MSKQNKYLGGRPSPRQSGLVTPTFIDRAVAIINPKAARDRLIARHQYNALTGSGGFKGARYDRRPTSSWRPDGGSADADILYDLEAMRNRSRDLERNSPLAKGTIKTNVTNIVGGGLTLQAQIDREALSLSEEQAKDWERAAEREFRLWSTSTMCDATNVQMFGEMQQTTLSSILVSGDIFAYRRFMDDTTRRYGLSYKLIEADRCQQPNNLADGKRLNGDGNRVCGGVEYDDDDAPVAYWFLRSHPGALNFGSRKWDRYPINGEQSQRRQILHLFERERADQSRGVPYLAPVIEALKQLDQYSEAEIQAAVVSSFLTVFTKTLGGEGMDPTGTSADTGAKASDDDVKLAPGAIVDLLPGEDIEIVDPSRPNPAYDGFVMAVMRQVGVALELPFEVLIKHFTASYSAARAAIIEAWKYFRKRRQWLASRLCQPVYEEFLYEAILRGYLKAPGFLNDPIVRLAYCGARWNGPGQPSLNPKQEFDAYALAEDRGWITATQSTAELFGSDFDRNLDVREGELKRKAAAGLGSESAPERIQTETIARSPDDVESSDQPDQEEES